MDLMSEALLRIKKLSFAPLFLLSYAYSLYLFKNYIGSYESVFSLSSNSLIDYLTLSGFILLTSLCFVVLGSFAQNWKLVSPVILLGAVLPVLIIPQPLSLVLVIVTLISLILIYTFLENKLKTYVTFQPTHLLIPSIKNLTLFLILGLSFGYFLSVNSKVQKNGFEIPDSLIEQAVKLSTPSGLNVKGDRYLAQNLTSEQIELLKQNPDLLKQYGIDPKALDTQPKQANQQTPGLGGDLVKNLVKDQFKNIIKPYLGIIPAVLAFLFFLALQSLSSLLSIFLNPILWALFYILEKSGFVKFEKEMREVKKIVI